MARLKSSLIKTAELLLEKALEIAGIIIAVIIMGFVGVYQGLIWVYKKVVRENV